MDILLVIAVLASLSAPGLTSSCSKKIDQLAEHEDNICIAFDNVTDENAGPVLYDPKRGDISISVLNHSTGVVEVKFPLASSSKYESYKLSLYVLEADLTDEECRNEKFPFTLHSVKYFDVFNCSVILMSEGEHECSPSCSRMGVVKFSYVFRGCYYVRLTAQKNGSERPYVDSLRANVHTGYRKQPLWGFNTTAHHQCFHRKDDTWELRITYVSELIRERIPLKMWLGSVLCIFNDRNTHLAAWVLNYTHTGSLECSSKVTSPTSPNNCTLLPSGAIECTFSNILPGNYCVTLIPSDPTRCNLDSPAWTRDLDGHLKTCVVFYPFGCHEEQKIEHLPATIPVHNNKDGIFITVGALLSVAIVGAIVFLIARKHFKPRPVRMIMDSVMSTVQSSNPQVLLLYAQDCKEFMQLMTTFRHLLTNVGHCKVLDCFDPDRAEEIAKSPVEWIRRWVSSPEVKVVVVASDCAVVQQKALSRGISLYYKEPLPNSHLFRYGLQEVTYNHDYTNTFVVRFDEQDLSYLTPYTRYVLPLHLQELLKSLNPSLDVSCVGEYKDEQKFRDNHCEMMKFKRQNPDYLVHLMAKSGDAVCA